MRQTAVTPRRPEGTRPAIPDHEILRIIGKGAYGEVWLARSITGAYRAVKVVWREDFADDALFAQEFEGILNYEPIARDIAGLVHILHVGRHGGDNPYYYYVMEPADDAYTGIHLDPEDYTPRTLQSDMKLYGRRAMPLDYVLEVACQLSRALEALHAEGLTHRDVKPANIIFVNGRAKLADAGLVSTGNRWAYVGTEGYIPPEGPGSPRADVYALAKVLYEMGTGMDRLSFPTLPDELPEGTSHRRWIQFNRLICSAAEPTVGKTSITTAPVFAERLEALRDDVPHRRRRRQQRRTERDAAPRFRLSYAAVAILSVFLAGIIGMYFLPDNMHQRVRRALAELAGTPPPPLLPPLEPLDTPELPTLPSLPTLPAPSGGIAIASGVSGSGQLFIGSVPSSASIYTMEGEYVDETPYGPITVKSGKQVSFIIRKDGFADAYAEGVIPNGKMLSLTPALRPYCPPVTGQPWQDAQQTNYIPAGGLHKAEQPVTAEQFEEFLSSRAKHLAPIPYEKRGEAVSTTQEGISAFTLWLTRQCEEAGTIGRDHSLIARPEPGTEGENKLCSYRLYTMLVQKTPISIYSNPPGARVTLNGLPLGVTPMQDMKVPLAPYLLEVRLPGYTTVRRSGLSPRDLVLNLNLKPNHSLIFGSRWINSLGMKLLPVAPSLMAAATEVRVSDYREFCKATGTRLPEHPTAEHNEHHPVVNVSRKDAEAFAAWLTKSEQDNGLIEPTDFYRLPTDAEWSILVGCGAEKGNTPYDKHRHHVTTAGRFPWGNIWPPPRGSGNYADMSTLGNRPADHILPKYRDDFPFTSPVGSFPANALGIHDLSGNVQEWVSDEYGGPEDFQFRHYGVTRGGDYFSFRPGQLSSHSRIPHPPVMKRDTIGFRLVLERRRERAHP